MEQRTLSNPFRELAKGKGIRVAEWLVGNKVDVVVSREDLSAKALAHVLNEAGVQVRTALSDELVRSLPFAVDGEP